MKNRSLFFAITALTTLGLLVSACCASSHDRGPGSNQSPGTKKPQLLHVTNYVLVPKNLGNPYFDTANNGAQEAAKELGITVLYQGSATADATEQITLLNSLIAQKPCGLLFQPTIPMRLCQLVRKPWKLASLLLPGIQP